MASISFESLDAWSQDYWSGTPSVLRLGGEDLVAVLARQFILDAQRHGSRARLARSIRGVRHLDLPDRSHLKRPQLVFSGDGRGTYARHLESVKWSDFVGAHPVRDYSRHRGQKNKPIAFYSRTVRDLVNCESRLERSFVLVADFDPSVVHVGAQSCAIQFPVGDEMRVHTVDFIVLAFGRIPIAVDVKTPEAAAQPEWVARHERVRHILAQAGVGHVVWTGHSGTVIENLAFLASSRIPVEIVDRVRAAAVHFSREPQTVGQLAASIAPYIGDLPATNGRSVNPRSMALVVVRALLWDRFLRTDLSIPFTQNSPVAVS